MATQQERITALAQAIASDIKNLNTNQGSLTALSTTNKTSLVAALNELKTAIASDIKNLTTNQGSLTALSTTNKTSLVAALNELKTAIANAPNINDSATNTSSTWSSDKINTTINNAAAALVNGAGTTLDTLKELANALGNDANFAASIATQMGKRVRVDAAQTFTVAEQAQGCANLGIGNPDTDFVAAYTTAKA